MVDDASCHLSCYTSTHASIWHHYGDGHLKFFQEGSSRNRGRSLVGRFSILHWSHVLLFAILGT